MAYAKSIGRGAARQHLHLSLRREGVDLLGVQIDLQVLEELVRIPDFLLPLQQLTHPLEVLLVALITDASLFVLPMGRDAFFRTSMHLVGADLDLERKAAIANHRRME